ncbi:MAG: hypothetical protein Q4C26_08060 [Bacteroidales bacterium]|nr:hypothetical protein [Bacteroidales bacterium]
MENSDFSIITGSCAKSVSERKDEGIISSNPLRGIEGFKPEEEVKADTQKILKQVPPLNAAASKKPPALLLSYLKK